LYPGKDVILGEIADTANDDASDEESRSETEDDEQDEVDRN
jgi:hypothetical protein